MVGKNKKFVRLEDSVVGVSFSPGKHVSLVLGERVSVNVSDTVLVEGREEYVVSKSQGVLETIGYDGNVIVHGRRVLNNGVIHSFHSVVSLSRYLPNNPRDRKDYKQFKGILDKNKIYPN